MIEQIAIDGYSIVPDVIGADEAASLIAAIESASEGDVPPGRGGLRNLLERIPRVRELADCTRIRKLVEPILGERAFVTRGILFEKTPEANWKVPWHQDLTIAVQRRIDVAGFGPWTIKEGVHHVQPPTEILESMLAVRIHLDPSSEENGALRVIPGTHSLGRLNVEEIHSIQTASSSIPCTVTRGGVLLMRPLLLHKSSASSSPSHRRVIHLEFAACSLPGGLRWRVEDR